MNKWEEEPNYVTGEHCGYKTVIIRNKHSKNLCGYVAIPADHPFHGIDSNTPVKAPESILSSPIDTDKLDVLQLMAYSLSPDKGERDEMPMGMMFRVHGGITYCADREPKQEPDGNWWLGFDCAHSGDLSPGLGFSFSGDIYRDIEYVKAECEALAQQLRNFHPKEKAA